MKTGDSYFINKRQFEWPSRINHILFFFAYTVNYSAGFSVLLQASMGFGTTYNSTLQFLFLTITLGAPLLFLQMSIGQYTRKGCLIIGEMFPAAYGLGYVMLMMAYFDLVAQIFYATKLGFYALVTVCNSKPAWMSCYSYYDSIFNNCISREHLDQCGSRENKTLPCFQPLSKILSSYIFKEAIAFQRITIPTGKLNNSPWFVSRPIYISMMNIFNSGVLYIFLMAGVGKSLRNIYTIMKWGLILCTGLLSAMGVVLFIQPGVLGGMRELLKIFTHPNLFVLQAWTKSVRLMVMALRLQDGGQFVFGSFIPREKPDYWRFMVLISVYLGVILAEAVYFHLFLGLLLFKLSMPIRAVIPETEENAVFVLFPTILGIMPSSSFFSLAYFFVLFSINLCSMLVKMIVLELTLSTYFPLKDYTIYLRYAFCNFACINAFLFEEKTVAAEILGSQQIYNVCSIIIVTVQILMVMIYGVESCIDDVEFVMKVRVNVVLKILWILALPICGVTIIETWKGIDFTVGVMMKIILMVLFTAPMLFFFVLRFFQLAKKKNLIGMLRPTDKYGPPGFEDKIRRFLYNARLSVRYRKYEEVCTHGCLLNAAAVRTAVEEEILQFHHFSNELKAEGGGIHLGEVELSTFAKHKKYLSRILDSYKKKRDVPTDVSQT